MLDETWHIWASANADWDQDNRVVGKARQIGENLKSVTKICRVKTWQFPILFMVGILQENANQYSKKIFAP